MVIFIPFAFRGGKVTDADQNVLRYYDIVPKIYKKLHKERIRIGAVSVAKNIAATKQLIYLFEWATWISFAEVFPGHISEHFDRYIFSYFGVGGYLRGKLSASFWFTDCETDPIHRTKICCISMSRTVTYIKRINWE